MFQVFQVFQVFHFAFGPKKRPFLVQIGTKQMFQVFQVFQLFQVFRNPYSLPFREGQGVGFPLTKREARLTKRACERLTKCEARLTHKKGVSGFQVQDTHNASNFTNMTWIGLNLSGWNVTRLFHLRCFEL